jgi:hypothetical protein
MLAAFPQFQLRTGQSLQGGSMAGSRERIVDQIQQANRAAAVGRLLLGEIKDWQEFLELGHVPVDLPRRNLRGGSRDVRRRLSKSLASFADRNFVDASPAKLSALYEEIKAFRGLEMSLGEFQTRFLKFRPSVLRGTPAHATVVISLWGLQFMFPEDFLAKDIVTQLTEVIQAEKALTKYRQAAHSVLADDKEAISQLIARKAEAQRSCFHSCFSLLEAYLNGVAWEANQKDSNKLIAQDAAYLRNCAEKSLSSRLLEVPRILGGRQLWDKTDRRVQDLLDTMKPLRDSLTHPSPFRAPEKFGGYDKLRNFYRVETSTVVDLANLVCNLLAAINSHISASSLLGPGWLDTVKKTLAQIGDDHARPQRSDLSS